MNFSEAKEPSQIGSLKQTTRDNEEDSLFSDGFSAISDKHAQEKQEEALLENFRAIELASTRGDKSQYVENIFLRAGLFVKSNLYDSVIFYSKKCIIASIELEEEEYTNYVGKSYNQIGNAYFLIGDESEGLKYYIKALKVFEKADHSAGIGASSMGIAGYYVRRENYTSAVDHYEAARKVFEQINRPDQTCIIWNNMGVLYFLTGEFEKALIYIQKSLDIAVENKYDDLLSSRELNIGRIYIEYGFYLKAEQILRDAYKHALKAPNKRLQCSSIIYLGILKNKLKDYHTALYYYNKGLILTNSFQIKDLEVLLYENMAENFVQLQSFDSAYVYRKKYDILKDSLNDVSRIKQVVYLREKFEADQLENEIILLRIEDEKKGMLRTTIIVVLLLILIVFTLLYYSSRIKQKALASNHQHREEMSRQQITQLLKDRELNNVKSKLEGKELERKRVAQELHDGIGGSLAGIKMNLIRVSKMKENNLLEVHKIIDRMDVVCEEVRSVAHDLIPPSFTDSSFTELVSAFLLKSDKVSKADFHFELFPKKGLNRIDIKIQIEIYRIIQELIVNINKHAKATEVNLSLILHDNYVNLIVEDDGIGFQLKSKKEGLGLKNIRSRIEELGGEIVIDSQLNKGTSINLDIPVSLPDRYP